MLNRRSRFEGGMLRLLDIEGCESGIERWRGLSWTEAWRGWCCRVLSVIFNGFCANLSGQ